uniref:Uncharacterized protein n=1 Tax=Callorhinchus milii TaxID=7868 RepID=A0A4W3HMG3_CALMI
IAQEKGFGYNYRIVTEGLCLMVTMISSCCLSGQLAKELKQQECLQYAGFCNLAMAQSLSGGTNPSLGAIGCHVSPTKYTVTTLYGESCEAMNKPGEAFVSYQRAAELQTQVPIECVLSLGKVASCKLLTRDSDGALAVFTEMQLLAQEKGLHLPGTNIPVGDSHYFCSVSEVILLSHARVTILYIVGFFFINTCRGRRTWGCLGSSEHIADFKLAIITMNT